jgi:hypothetical protein
MADKLMHGKKGKHGEFTLDDFMAQMESVRKMGSLGKLLQMLPGMGDIKEQLNQVDDRDMDRIVAIIRGMTPAERDDPKLINGSRRLRIANGSGVTVREVNDLVNRFYEARKMMQQMAGRFGFPGAGRGGSKTRKGKKGKKGKKDDGKGKGKGKGKTSGQTKKMFGGPGGPVYTGKGKGKGKPSTGGTTTGGKGKGKPSTGGTPTGGKGGKGSTGGTTTGGKGGKGSTGGTTTGGKGKPSTGGTPTGGKGSTGTGGKGKK